jgi:hypothetical protein
MSLRTKTIIGSALALAVALWGWYAAYSDGDPTTQPNTSSVIVAGNELVDAVKTEEKTATDAAAPEVVK